MGRDGLLYGSIIGLLRMPSVPEESFLEHPHMPKCLEGDFVSGEPSLEDPLSAHVNGAPGKRQRFFCFKHFACMMRKFPLCDMNTSAGIRH